jgi:hypothetical protein
LLFDRGILFVGANGKPAEIDRRHSAIDFADQGQGMPNS